MRIFRQRTRRLAAVFFVVAGIVTTGTTFADTAAAPTKKNSRVKSAGDFSAAPGPSSWSSFRNGNQQLGVAHGTLPKKLELLWKIPLTDGTAATAAIVGAHVYAGTYAGEVLCLDRRTGKTVWKYLSAEKTEPDTFIPGFKASPTVTADSIYVGDEDGVFHAIDRQTGKVRWKYLTQAEIISSATVVGERVIFGSYDNSLYCLNAQDGTLAWKYETEGYVNCSPAISGNYTFVTGCDEHLRVINIESGQQEFAMPLETYLIASPSVVGDMLYVGTYASEVIAVNWKEQEITWRYKGGDREFPYHSSTAVTEKYVVVGGRDKQVHCIDRSTGKKAWTAPTRNRVDSSPVVLGERVFVGSSDGNLYEFELSTGKEVWKYNIGREVTASPAIGENCLVIGNEASKGYLYCFGEK